MMLVGSWDVQECYCGICRGNHLGKCGYRPHTLDPACWCITGTRTECNMTRWLRHTDIRRDRV